MLRRIFGKKPKPPPPIEVRELSLDSLGEEIKKLKDDELKAIEGEVGPLVEGIARACEETKASAEALAQAQVSKEVYVGLDRSSREARRLFVEKVTRAIDGLRQPKELTWQGLLAFGDSLDRALDTMVDAGVVHGRYASVLFGQHVQGVYQSIRKLQELGAQFKAAMEVKKDEVQNLDNTSAQIADLKDLAQRLVSLGAKKDALEGRVKGLGDVLEAEGVEFDKLTCSQELKDVEKIRHELGQIEQKISRLRGEAASAISGLQRPFKKMKKLALDGKHPLGKDGFKMLDLCIDEPLEAFLSDGENLPRLTALLQDLEGLIEGGQIELNPRERRKRLEQIRGLLSGTLLELKREHDDSQAKKAEKERAYMSSPLLKRREELEKSLEVHRSELEKVQSELSLLSREMEKIEEEIGRRRSKLESEASIVLGIKLKIV
jgi:hypothetical protein